MIITENRSLRELHGLENVRVVSGLYLRDNPKLQSLEGLSGLQEVRGDVEIWGNPQLSSQEVHAFIDGLDIGGEVRLSPPEGN